MARKDKDNLRYTPLPDATPESELDALTTIYKFVVERDASKKVADPTGDRNEATEANNFDPKRRLPQ